MYTYCHKIAEGSYGVVYKIAKDGMKFALKTFQWSDDYLNELDVLRYVKHKNIVEMIEFGFGNFVCNTRMDKLHTISCTAYCIMPLAVGTLREFIGAHPTDDGFKTGFMKDIICGLVHLRDCNILHLDLKPDNILIFEEEGTYRAKLCDFSNIGRVYRMHDWSAITNRDRVTSYSFSPPLHEGNKMWRFEDEIKRYDSKIFSCGVGVWDEKYSVYSLGILFHYVNLWREEFVFDRESKVDTSTVPTDNHMLLAMLAKDPSDRHMLSDVYLHLMGEAYTYGMIQHKDIEEVDYTAIGVDTKDALMHILKVCVACNANVHSFFAAADLSLRCYRDMSQRDYEHSLDLCATIMFCLYDQYCDGHELSGECSIDIVGCITQNSTDPCISSIVKSVGKKIVGYDMPMHRVHSTKGMIELFNLMCDVPKYASIVASHSFMDENERDAFPAITCNALLDAIVQQ